MLILFGVVFVLKSLPSLIYMNIMDSDSLFKLLSSVSLLFIGIMAKFSVSDGWQPVKKYWMYFVIMGLLSFMFMIYKYFLK